MRRARVDAERKAAARKSKLRAEFREVIAAIGLQKEFDRLPTSVRDLVRQPYPKPQVIISTDGAVETSIAQEINAFIDTTERPGRYGHTLSLAQFFSHFLPLMHFFAVIQEADGTHAVTKARELTASFYKDYGGAFLIGILKGTDDVLMKHSRIDRGIWWADVKSIPLPKGGNFLQINISRQSPQVVRVGLDGKGEQPAYRCGAPFHGIKWVDWPSALVRRPEWGRDLPVYVQQHALDAFRERLTLSGPEVEDFM